jgi:ornithine carbamoyltransferase
VQDHKRQLAGLRVALLSAGGPVTASWLRAARALQLRLTCVCPPGHEPDVTTVKTMSEQYD